MTEVIIHREREIGYFWIDNNFITGGWCAFFKPYAAAVYACLSMHADNKTQSAWPSYDTIAAETGTSRRQVIRAVKNLEKYHVISKERRNTPAGDQTSNLIILRAKSQWITPGSLEKKKKPEEPKEQKGSDTQSPPSDTQSPPSDYQSPELDSVNSDSMNNNKNNGRANAHRPLSLLTVDNLSIEVQSLIDEYISQTDIDITDVSARQAKRLTAAANRLGNLAGEAISDCLNKNEAADLNDILNYLEKWKPPETPEIYNWQDGHISADIIAKYDSLDAVRAVLARQLDIPAALIHLEPNGDGAKVKIDTYDTSRA